MCRQLLCITVGFGFVHFFIVFLKYGQLVCIRVSFFFVFCFFIIFLGYLNLVVSTSTPSRGLEETARTSYHMAQDRAQ